MKRERRDGSPPLSADNALGVGAAALEPGAASGPRPGHGKKPDQHEADGDTEAQNLLELELDGGLDVVDLGLEVLGVGDGGGELASCGKS